MFFPKFKNCPLGYI
jgi:hypothetical protein